MSGADKTGRFYGKGKPIYWEAFYQRTKNIFAVFPALGTTLNVPGVTLAGIERLVCNLQPPNTHVKNFSFLTTINFLKYFCNALKNKLTL